MSLADQIRAIAEEVLARGGTPEEIGTEIEKRLGVAAKVQVQGGDTTINQVSREDLHKHFAEPK